MFSRLKRVLYQYTDDMGRKSTHTVVVDRLCDERTAIERILDDHGIEYVDVRIIDSDYRPNG